MNAFLKENGALVIAISLPLLFAGFFLLTKTASTAHIQAPQHDFVIVKDQYTYTPHFEVINGELQASYTYPSSADGGTLHRAQAYYVPAATMIAEPINIILPEDAIAPLEQNLGKRISIDLPQFKNKAFSAASISPDGFELDYDYNHDGNLMTEIFSTNQRYDDGMALVKEGKAFRIRGLKDNYGYTIAGWIIPESNQGE